MVAGLFLPVISLMLKLYWNGMLQAVHETQAISEILALALLMLFKGCKLCLHFFNFISYFFPHTINLFTHLHAY